MIGNSLGDSGGRVNAGMVSWASAGAALAQPADALPGAGQRSHAATDAGDDRHTLL